ncbi:MAG: hypothetical protein GX557_10910, partial [Chloroflexi bacterium]|nr:hypothetical protein [Chloroflexota bacterium]
MSASSAEIPLRQRQLIAGMAGALLSLAVLLMPPPATLLGHPLGSQALALARVAVLLLMPGLTLLRWVRPFDRLDDLQRLCLAPLVSLALMPLLLLWVGLTGSRWSAHGVQAFLVACALRLIISLLRRWSRGRSTRSPRRAPARLWLSVGLVATFGAALALRLAMIREMVYPAWVDSYQHTIITQIILDTGRVPTSYAPFHDLPGFVYHFGFHAWSAFVGWVTGLPAHQAVLWGGQVLNALTVPGLFLLVDRLAGDRRAALIAALIAGLFSRMPAYYVNWGRYPQLAGQVLLPVAVLATAEALSTRRESWRAIPIAALLAGGLLLTHYRIAIFYLAAALVALGAAWLRAAQRPAGRARPLSWWQVLGRLAIIGALALLLALPWLPDLVAKTLDTAQQVLAASDGAQYDYITLALVLDYGLRPVLLIALGASVLWALLRARRRPLGLAIVVWLALIVFLANPRVSGLPSGFLTNGAVIMALYLPAALLIGQATSDLYGLLQGKLRGRWRVALSAALVIALLALGGWGGYWLARTGIEPWYQLV